MRALVVEDLLPDYAGCVVKEIPTPEPGPGEVRIKVRAAAVNFPDLMQTRGEHQHKPTVPFVGGLELAGEVDKLGEGVTGFAVGDAVVSGGRGGFAEYAILPASTLRPKPERLSFGEAAGYPVAYLTAYVALKRAADAQPGEWVLVHGAAGGVGLAAVDYAKVMGCKVIAASASDEKLAVIAKEYDVDATVNVTRGFRERVKEITGGKGADVIYDPVGGDIFDESIRCIAFGGRILSIGFTSGRLPVLPVNIALIKGFSVHGVRAGEYGRQFPQKGAENNEAIWKLAEDGLVKPRVDAEYPLDGWREAFETLAQRKVVGKTIIRPDL
ncbi:MAG: NADPH:quinone oxidoreductase family protein [Alphaproteobacteria bacterium]|nr:NADPH:quinone oxidoreductase family protein [Alphaproteobacteria bacterium]MBU1514634.1 NADPH:quinone oxidoreductase family protein [Alphaproteobacteria bacterium]MBU2096734.1 NADPH:quinone oxidoreductase family protein [Alphaproteobacteria bacterium]MBU2150366.1 NADPH:quinone oxidoreductase family protein [Alphaproteobacteria bacterium]MBU2306633.1 NADPH:quinone oxidoreductase family protein [Alphaproteobacteria bacterium]